MTKDTINVMCGQLQGILHASRFGPGCRSVCIEHNGKWLTPNEFEALSGKESNRNWKRNIVTTDSNKSVKILLEEGFLTKCPAKCGCKVCQLCSRKFQRRSSTHENTPSDLKAPTVKSVPKTSNLTHGKRKALATSPLKNVINEDPSKDCSRYTSPMKIETSSNEIIEQAALGLHQGLLRVVKANVATATQPAPPANQPSPKTVVETKNHTADHFKKPKIQQSVIPARVDYVSMVQEAVASLAAGAATPEGCSSLHVLLYILNRYQPPEDIQTVTTKTKKAIAFLARMGILNRVAGDPSSDDSDPEPEPEPQVERAKSEPKVVRVKSEPRKKIKTENPTKGKKPDTVVEKPTPTGLPPIKKLPKTIKRDADGNPIIASAGKLKKLSPNLVAIVGVDTMRRFDVIKEVWNYVRVNRLQNPKQRGVIFCDEKLRKITKKKKVSQPELYSAIHKNFRDIKGASE